MFLFLFLFEFPIQSFSATLYELRYSLENISYTNSTSDNCLLPNLTFAFNTIFNFTLNNCKVKKCYAIIDRTCDMKWGNTGNLRPSAFINVSITGARYLHKSAGIIFKPTASTVNIVLQTQRCHDFYTMHPYETTENCYRNLPISNVVRGLPFCRDID